MIVIDASVAVKWVLDEEDSDRAWALQNEELTAPSLWLMEAASTLWRRARNGEITGAEAAEFLADLEDGPIDTIPIEQDLAAALTLAHLLNHPPYDCLYLAAAVRLGALVVTSDRRFADAAVRGGLGDRVRLLTDYAPSALSS
jgi:predicted nucleic acid-binding protein